MKQNSTLHSSAADMKLKKYTLKLLMDSMLIATAIFLLVVLVLS